MLFFNSIITKTHHSIGPPYGTYKFTKFTEITLTCLPSQMDGTWYLSAVATDLQVQGECAMVLFDHQNTLDVSIKWITNHTASYYNGSVALIPDPNSNTTGDLLQVTYDGESILFMLLIGAYHLVTDTVEPQDECL